MKSSHKQLIGLIAVFFTIVSGYVLIDGLFTPQGMGLMRKFYHQGGIKALIPLFQTLAWKESLMSAGLQLGLLAAIFLLAVLAKSRLEKISEFLLNIPRKRFLGMLFILAFVISTTAFCYKFQFFARSGDTNAILFQAKILAKGAITVPAHPLKDFFYSDYIINNTRMYAQYPLGTSFVLMWGVLLGMPWIINPLLGAFGLIFLYLTAVELYDEVIARYGIFIILISPLYIEYSASYLSHIPQFFFLSIFTYYFIKTIRLPVSASKNRYPVISGMALGMAINTRPMTALTVSLPFLCWGIYFLIKDWRAYYKKVILFTLGLTPFLLGLFLVNMLQNGHPLLFGHKVYNGPRPTIGFGSEEYTVSKALSTYFFRMVWLTKRLVYGSLLSGGLLSLLALSFMDFRKNNYFLWAVFISTSIGYLPVASSVWQFRYYFTATLYLLLLLPLGIRNLGDWGARNFKFANGISLLTSFLLIITILFLGGFNLKKWVGIDYIRRPYDIAAQADLKNALVFVRKTRAFYPRWYTRNSPDFNDPVLWALDLGERNKELMAYYPGRKAYLYDNGKLTLIRSN